MLGHVAEDIPVGTAHGTNGSAVPENMPLRRHELIGDDVHERGFTGAVGPEDTVDTGG